MVKPSLGLSAETNQQSQRLLRDAYLIVITARAYASENTGKTDTITMTLNGSLRHFLAFIFSINVRYVK